MNWPRIIIHYLSILIISRYIYYNFIDSVQSLLPDFTDLKNEIWLLIIIFLYQIGNGFDTKHAPNSLQEPEQAYLPELKNRKKKYILRKHEEFKTKYGNIIDEITGKHEPFNLLVYSILIFENFNRPRIVRLAENIWSRITKKVTTQGLMQVSTTEIISDEYSVQFGTKRLFNYFKSFANSENTYNSYRRVLKRQCPDKKYVRQILFISKAIIDNKTTRSEYKDLFSEIKSEFNLYDFYD